MFSALAPQRRKHPERNIKSFVTLRCRFGRFAACLSQADAHPFQRLQSARQSLATLPEWAALWPRRPSNTFTIPLEAHFSYFPPPLPCQGLFCSIFHLRFCLPWGTIEAYGGFALSGTTQSSLGRDYVPMRPTAFMKGCIGVSPAGSVGS